MATRISRIVFAAAATMLLGTPTALAGGYVSSGSEGGAASGASGSATAAGSLPFTGLDLALIVVGGLMLLASGLLLRRASRSS
jgi:hypothetical protein